MLPDMTRKYSRFEIEYTRDWNRMGCYVDSLPEQFGKLHSHPCNLSKEERQPVLEQAKRVREFANEASRLADSLVRQLEAET